MLTQKRGHFCFRHEVRNRTETIGGKAAVPGGASKIKMLTQKRGHFCFRHVVRNRTETIGGKAAVPGGASKKHSFF